MEKFLSPGPSTGPAQGKPCRIFSDEERLDSGGVFGRALAKGARSVGGGAKKQRRNNGLFMVCLSPFSLVI